MRLWESRDLSYQEITAKLEIRDPKRVKEWTRNYRKEGLAGLKKPCPGRPQKKQNSLEERLQQLDGHRARGRIVRRARYRAIYRYRKQFNLTAACA